jgi:decaprenylphospho-beta-D-ribofuranose 2-oxidase
MPEHGPRPLTGWGRATWSTADVVAVHAPAQAEAAVRAHAHAASRGLLGRGLGRSYGDAALNGGGVVLDMTAQTGPLELDAAAGQLRVGGGVSLDAVLRAVVPAGWFVPVTPGTRFVTVGGAIAADVHGKNHHRAGSFCEHLLELTLLLADGSIRVLRPEHPADERLFWATAGGMGLTGVVLEAVVRLEEIAGPRLHAHHERAGDLEATLGALEAAEEAEPYAVAWLDVLARGRSLGRGIVSRGHFAAPAEIGPPPTPYEPATLQLPTIEFPGGVINRSTVPLLNAAWYHRVPRRGRSGPTSIGAFFHPLDAVGDWNRVYGPAGFLQWQCLVPSAETLERIVVLLAAARVPSFVTVLKRFRAANPGPLSFPAAGWTLAVDAATSTPGLGELLDELDEAVAIAGGRIYLAKDSRLRPELLDVMYPRLPEFQAVRDEVDPNRVFRSDLARRLGL